MFKSQAWLALAAPVIAVLLSIATGGVLFLFFDIAPFDGLYYFLLDPLRDGYGVSELLLKISPIVLCALGLLLCFKAGVWNIGAEGQYLAGCMAAGWCALQLADSEGFWCLPLVLLAGVLGGLLWAAMAAALKVRVGANEILTTIMLNYIAVHLLMYLVNGPLKDPGGFSFPESAIFAGQVMLPVLSDSYRLNISIFFPLVLVALLWLLLKRSRFGFELGVVGNNPAAAQNAGISINRHVVLVLLISGACAGLAGAAEVTGPVGQLIPQLSVGYGYTAIICVYLGRMHPVGVLLAAMLLGVTYVGAESVQLQYELPSAIAAAFQGLILFYLLAADKLINQLQPKVER
ncbi:ABC transporter permease [Halioxenophilus sp. WMMB6]|uniref:ABC transporter permease n=1 Tax=Halioxenophilus sp. WMMB6 TaxID=3073815 RepID=UPI00295EB0BB|nr:ABC transporter permease [Halioxenophilus sp. WMMB6]